MTTRSNDTDILTILKSKQEHNNSLKKYLPHSQTLNEMKLHEQNSLNIEFSSIQQINKSISFEKQHINRQLNIFYQSLTNLEWKIGNLAKVTTQTYKTLDNTNIDILWKTNLDLPTYDLTTIQYSLPTVNKEVIKLQKQQKTDQINNLSLEISKLQKQCAQLFTQQSQFLQKTQFSLLNELQQIQSDLKKRQDQSSGLKFIQEIQKLIKTAQNQHEVKINQCKKHLNQKFDKKLLSIIQKVQRNALSKQIL